MVIVKLFFKIVIDKCLENISNDQGNKFTFGIFLLAT